MQIALRDPSAGRRVVVSWLVIVVMVVVASAEACGDPPPGYYDGTTGLSGSALHNTLHGIIDDHTRFPYTASSTDTWDILADAHENPAAPNNVLTVYRNGSVPKSDHSAGTGWNREHTWPKSYGFPDDGGCNYPYTDCHVLMPADWDYNAARSNLPFDDCPGGCDSYPVIGFPASPNLASGGGSSGSWETWSGRRGDVARALFYLAVRYDGGTHGITGCSEPDLILTDDRSLIDVTNGNASVAYMGLLETLIEWHLDDPVDAFELNKNDVVMSYQGNRNPFIDHPEWVCAIWVCPGVDTTPPAIPTGLVATGSDCAVSLTWSANTEPDFAGYELWRGAVGGPLSEIATGLVSSSFVDVTAENGESYDYALTAYDIFANESALSPRLAAAPTGSLPCGGGPVTGDPWLNEIHYDNISGDTGEGFEIAGPAGTNLSGYTLIGYNGSSGAAYDSIPLSGTIPNQTNGYGTLWFAFLGMQNGSPDGLALVAPGQAVLQFLSYEGAMTAIDGPAAGMTSSDIGVTESNATAIGHSLPLLGTGATASDFTWSPEQPGSPGLPNPGQTFTGSGGCTTPGADCNGNGITDPHDIALGNSLDTNGNAVPDECEPEFSRGDANLDASLDISDPILILAALFGSTTLPCRDAADVNDSGAIDVADVVALLGTMFQGTPVLPAPGLGCGVDPTDDNLDCASSVCP